MNLPCIDIQKAALFCFPLLKSLSICSTTWTLEGGWHILTSRPIIALLRVKFFSLGPDRIFTPNRAIIGRDVRMCHPPSSVHVVEQILSDFKSGKQNSAAFWISMQGRFIYIEYLALRDSDGIYLGTIEFTQDLTKLRKLEGEQRLLSYIGR